MPLSPGTRLGPYEILAPIGAGGMGEVYRGKDTRLDREVAIKVLPPALAQDPERLARFEREAKVLASLNHPNIAQIYGIEERALAMELVEGETLPGPLPVGTALQYARQIAEALDAAHEKGIVHRDLKPANIMITPAGVVKVLDFGLAKAAETAAGSHPANTATMTLAATQAGAIMGTAAYMSPEQARGKTVDKRADVWAFGAVLYEMLTGRQAFVGETVTDVLVNVVTMEPDWTALPPGSPIQLLRRCLEKDPKRRLRDIGDAFSEPEPPPPAAQVHPPLWRHPLVVALLLLLIASSAGALFLWTRSSSSSRTVSRLVIPLPANQELTDYPAISPDGRIVSYTAQQGADEPQLYLRDLSAFEARAVIGSSGAKQPFFSPDGRWVAFFAQGQLLKAAVAGGSPAKIAAAAFPLGGTWNEDNTIIFTTALSSGLLRIPAGGGKPESLTKPDGAGAGLAHLWPQSLPGGRDVLFSLWGKGASGNAELSLDTRRWQLVLPGWGGAVYSPSGHLFVSDETAGLKAAPFDPAHPARTTAETPVLSDVYYTAEAVRSWLAISNTGTAVYAPGSPAKKSLAWVDRDGKVELLSKEQASFREVSIAPDGSKAVVKQGPDLWIHDFQSGTRRRMTFHENDEADNTAAVWSRDGARILFSSNAGGDYDIYSQPADLSRPAQVLLKRPYDQYPSAMAPDGTLVFVDGHLSTGEDLAVLSPDGKVSTLLATAFNATNAKLSPDARWLAYQSDETGRYEIYVVAYPGGGKRVAVSTEGGIVPAWSPDGKELFYCGPDALVAVAVRPDGSFAAPHRKLFDRSGFYFVWHTYDVSRDGKRFLMIRRDPGSVPRQLNVILNWFDELQRLALTRGK